MVSILRMLRSFDILDLYSLRVAMGRCKELLYFSDMIPVKYLWRT